MEKTNFTKHPFYELQSRLRQLGWYFEWTVADQENHIWEDMPSRHEDGPFKGDWIDDAKTLVSLTGERRSRQKRPKQYSGNDFFFLPEAEQNVIEILPIIKESGCRHRGVYGRELWIGWDKQ
tara:strand:- start:1171 stop:1536 length:366 start_codon:yes stop_codon:yes gene_type:complete